MDVEQIMRDIRSRIAKRHGIDLTQQQIHELAARRLEAILEPRHVKPSLMEQMRRAAGETVDVPQPAAEPMPEPFREAALYESHRSIVRLLRRWLNPILKLFFNPAPLVEALSAHGRRENLAAAREAEMHSRQVEWNALHFEILQRMVTDVSRATIEMQSLSMRLESLAAKLDFNERRSRSVENLVHQVRPGLRPTEAPASSTEPVRPLPAGTAGAPELVTPTPAGTEASPEGTRRRRRRRRGRRSGGGTPGEAGTTATDAVQASSADLEADNDSDSDDADEAEPGEIVTVPNPSGGEASTSLEPAHAFSLLQPAERHPSTEAPSTAPQGPPAGVTQSSPAAAIPPTPPRDEPAPAAPVDHAEPEPPDR